jgi:hypothetical protein
MKRKIFSILVVVSLLCTLVIANTALAANDDISSSDNIVSQSEADNAASYWMKVSTSRFSTWSEANLSAPVTYYSVEDNDIPIAYEYTVLNQGKSVGYMIVSASKDFSPILEFSNGKAPSSYIDSAKKFANRMGYNTDNENPLILYWGGLTYSVQYDNQMKDDRIAIHLQTGVLQNLPSKMNLQIDNIQARAAWEKLSIITSNISDNSKSLKWPPGQVMISGVPYYHQSSDNNGYGDDGNGLWDYPALLGPNVDPWDAWDGCSCIAAAMIHGYWYNQGYTNLPNDEDTLIDRNHIDMGTDMYGYTWPWDIDDGISSVFARYNYGNDFAVNNTTGTDWDDITTQVDAGNPAVMSYLGGTWGGHSATLVGYLPTYLGNYVVHHNTWDTTDDLLVYGDWTTCQMTKVEES